MFKFFNTFIFSIFLPISIFCVPNLDVKRIVIHCEQCLFNEVGQYSLDFSKIYPDLEEIEIGSNFSKRFFYDNPGDLGLSNNAHLKSIISRDNIFVSAISQAELPNLETLTMYFSRDFISGSFQWDWIHQFKSLTFLKVSCFREMIDNLFLNVSNCKQLEEFNYFNGRWWLSKTQQDLVVSMSHLKRLVFRIELMDFEYRRTVKAFNEFQLRFLKENLQIDAEFKMWGYEPPS